MSGKNVIWIPQQTRLNAYEREDLMRLALIIDLADGAKNTLHDRARTIPRGTARIGLIAASARTLFSDMLKTMTEKDVMKFTRELKSFSYHTGCKNPTLMGQRNRDDFGMWISFENLNTMFRAMDDHCMMCMKNGQEERSCVTRKALDDMGAAVDVDAQTCPYRELIGFNR